MTGKSLESYLAPRARPSFAIGAGLCIAAIATVALVFYGWQRFAKSEGFDDQLAKLQTTRFARAVPAPSPRQAEEAKQWAQVRMEKDFPWDKIFHAIERTASPDIELLEFHPDKLNHIIILRGEAKNIEALLAYLQDVSVKTGWNAVHLTHQEKVKHGALETISFEIRASLGNPA